MSKKERYGVIYKITNTVNGKCYIGQTIYDFNKRYHSSGNGIERVYNFYKKRKEQGRDYNVHLLGAIEKYGFEAFTVDEEFDVAYSKEKLDSLECKYIKEFNCIENGYNNKEGGANGKHSEEVRRRQSKRMSGKNNPMYGVHICGENNPNYGNHMSGETKKKISETLKNKYIDKKHFNCGRKHTEEEKIKMSEKAKERGKDPEYRRKMSESLKGKNCGENNPNYGNHKLAGRNNPRARKVICTTDNNIFDTMNECAEYYKLNINTVRHVCQGIVKKSRTGLKFMYYDEYLQQQKQTA